jgi:hypothetical protein
MFKFFPMFLEVSKNGLFVLHLVFHTPQCLDHYNFQCGIHNFKRFKTNIRFVQCFRFPTSVELLYRWGPPKQKRIPTTAFSSSTARFRCPLHGLASTRVRHFLFLYYVCFICWGFSIVLKDEFVNNPKWTRTHIRVATLLCPADRP